MRIKPFFFTVMPLTILLFQGCGDPFSNDLLREDARFLSAAPDAQVLQVKLPEQGTIAMNKTRQPLVLSDDGGRTGDDQFNDCAGSASNGGRALWYCFTDNFTHDVNQGVLGFLDLVDKVLEYPPSARANNRRIWGPWPGEEKDATDFRFEMERCEPGTEQAEDWCKEPPNGCKLGNDRVFYAYALEVRSKQKRNLSSDQGWVKAMQGLSVPFEGTRYGCGNLDFDVDRVASEDPTEKGKGSLLVQYDTRPPQADQSIGEYVKIDIVFNQFLPGDADEGTEPVDAQYNYLLENDRSGQFAYETRADLDENNPLRSAKEKLEIVTRWNTFGAGRGDVRISKGDLKDMVAYSHECWNQDFGRVYYEDTFGFQPKEGDEALCEFESWTF
ncbi:MAG: hypothetical protein GXP49_16810 [Deltaproteobacteria bacterium]|nr:hypothetical protein [Deltaproteobacteria bacterium]